MKSVAVGMDEPMGEKIMTFKAVFALLLFSIASTASATLHNELCSGCNPTDGKDSQVVTILTSYKGRIQNGDIVQIQDVNMESNPPNAYFYANWTYSGGQFTMTQKGYNYMASGGSGSGTGGGGGGTAGGGTGLPSGGGTYTFRCYITDPDTGARTQISCQTGLPIG